MFEHPEREGLVDRRKVVKEFRERPAVLTVIDERPNGHASSHKDGRAAKDFWIRMHSGNRVLHDPAIEN